MAYPNRLRPFSGRIVCVYVEIATCRHIRCNHIEDASMVAHRGSKYALRACASLERRLAWARKTMPNLTPVNQVATVKDGHTRKIFARSGHQIIILTYATDTRIGVKAGNYRIAIHSCSLSFSEMRTLVS